MSSSTKPRAFWPDLLRVWASFAVVMIHVHSWDFAKLNAADQRGFLLIDLFCYWSVPVFVMLSGGLLLSPGQIQSHEEPALFFRKRWRRMIRPTIVWAVLALAWGVAALGRGGEESLRRLVQGVPNDPQWFLFMLLGLYALTPWLRILLSSPRLERKHLAGLIAVLYAINTYVFLEQFVGFAGEIGFPANALLYLDLYLFGMIVSDPDAWSVSTDRKIIAGALGVTVILTAAILLNPQMIGQYRFFLSQYHSPVVLFQAVAVYRLALRFDTWKNPSGELAATLFGRTIRQLSDWSFGIYVIHPFVLSLLFKFFLRPIDGPFLLYSLAVWAVTMAACFVGCFALRWRGITAWMVP